MRCWLRSKERSMLLAAVPIAADGLALLLLMYWLLPLAAQLQERGGLNVLWLGGAYILLCLGVYAIRKLELAPAAPDLTLPGPRIRGALGLFFGLTMMTAVAWQLGFFDVALTIDPMELGEGEAASFFVFAPSAWLGLALCYILVLAFNVAPTVRRDTGYYPWLALAGLLGVNAMLLLATAQLRAIAEGAITGGHWLSFVASVVLLLFLFGPPRLLYLSRQPRLSAAVTFLALLASSAWWVGG